MNNIGKRAPNWRKSSHSGGGNDCVEVAFFGTSPAVRDSKNPEGGTLRFDAAQWHELLDAVRAGHLG